MFRIVIAFVLFVHGVGHILGPLRMANMTTVNPTWQGDSWLLSIASLEPQRTSLIISAHVSTGAPQVRCR